MQKLHVLQRNNSHCLPQIVSIRRTRNIEFPDATGEAKVEAKNAIIMWPDIFSSSSPWMLDHDAWQALTCQQKIAR